MTAAETAQTLILAAMVLCAVGVPVSIVLFRLLTERGPR